MEVVRGKPGSGRWRAPDVALKRHGFPGALEELEVDQ
jgi:hypothetical protein